MKDHIFYVIYYITLAKLESLYNLVEVIVVKFEDIYFQI